MKSIGILWSIAMLICVLPNSMSGYRILGILPTIAKSHYFVGSSLMKELARKGHEVTVISPFPLKKPLENFRDLAVPNVFKAMENKLNNVLDLHDMNVWDMLLDIHNMGLNLTRAVLEEKEVQALIRSNQKFDVVICEVFLSEALYGLAEHFNAPLIGLSTFGAHTWNTDMVGSPSPLSYVPSPMLAFTDHMSLVERVGNLAYATMERAFLSFYYLPKQQEIYKKYFSHLKRDLYEIRRNTALVLLNTHVSLSSPRPYMPNHIEVGGMHINRKRTPLPADIQKFIDEAKNGVIYFSMGSNLKSKILPLEKRKAILDTFRGLKQRVLWKFEEPNLEDKPDNVYISDWFPQDDILAHPNVKFFITHGGLLSITESIYHGKPFIGIPIFGDQFLNMGRAESNGYGIMMNYNDLTVESFTKAINRMLNDASYSKLVAAMSARFRDQPMEPLDLAVFWVEHVARHNGAKYLHCAGQDLNFFQYHNLDAILILYGGVLFILILAIQFLRNLLGLCFGKKEIKSNKKIKRN